MTVVTKTNLHLWLLTGRCDGFVNPLLNSSINYMSEAEDVAVSAARQFLRLHNSKTDFYVIGAMAAAAASVPSLRLLPDDRNLVFAEDMTALDGARVSGAVASPADNRNWNMVDGKVAGKEGFTSVTCTKISSDTVSLSRDDGFQSTEYYRMSDGKVIISNMEAHGVHAHFQVGTWAVGQSFTVTTPPERYPYRDFSTQIPDQPGLVQLMLEEGTMESFVSSVSPLHKVGALVAAIMTRTAKRTASMSHEFAITLRGAMELKPNGQLTVDWSRILLDGVPITLS